MKKSLLVRIFGFPATLIHGDSLVLDRWRWICRRLPVTVNGETLLDVGCGSGAFTIGAAKRGYSSLGLSWDERNQAVASERAVMCATTDANFSIQDVRELEFRQDLQGCYDVVLSCENIEHVLDDRKLMKSMAACLKPGGHLLLTTPNYYYRAITKDDNGPFSIEETGWHVRRGYTSAMLRELVDSSGLIVNEISFCSGFFSQKITWLYRVFCKASPLWGWVAIFALRLLPPLLDDVIGRFFRWPGYSICLVAYKPRFDK